MDPQGRPVGWYDAQKARENGTSHGGKGCLTFIGLFFLATFIAAAIFPLVGHFFAPSTPNPDEPDTPGLDRAKAGQCIPIDDTQMANHTGPCTGEAYTILARIKTSEGETDDQARAACAGVADMHAFFNHSYARPYYVLCLE